MRKLRSQEEIMATWLGDLDKPVVSICCATFNHVDYIEDALAGFLSQETDFAIEIIIRDDASVDGTTEVVRKYQRRYPRLIQTIVNPSNRFGLGERPIHVWPTVTRGEYIALCEGDDFWIKADKLQKQVELLQESSAVMCVAGTRICKQGQTELELVRETGVGVSGLVDFENISRSYFHTSTYLLRTDVLRAVVNEYFAGHALFGDTALRAILISKGPFIVHPEIVSVYRLTGAGIWTALDREKQLEWECSAGAKLSNMLQGKHAKRQKISLFRNRLALAWIYLRQGRIMRAAKQLPGLIRNSGIYIPYYLAVKCKALSSRLRLN